MKNIIISLLFAWAAQWAVAQEADTAWRCIDNTFLYERYAPRQDLLVAQLVHYPIGEGMYVNLVMLQAPDSTSFMQLLEEFGLAVRKSRGFPFSKHASISVAADRYDPAQPAPRTPEGKVDLAKSCMVFVYPGYLTLWIAHPKDEAEWKQMGNKNINHITDGKQF